MLQDTSRLVRTGCYILPSVLLFLVFYFLYFDRNSDRITIQLHLLAENSGVVALYWPDDSGNYAESQVAKVKYPVGESETQLTVSTFKKDHSLRLDPGVEKNRVVIKNISFSRFGIAENLNGEQIKGSIVSSKDTTLKTTTAGTQLSFTTVDPQIYMRNIPTPFPSWRQIFVLLLTCLLFTLVVFLRLLHQHPVTFRGNLLVSLGIFLVLGWIFWWHFYATLFISLFISYTIIHISLAFSGRENKPVYLLPIKAALTLGCFLMLIFLPLLNIDHSEAKFLKGVRSSAGKAWNDTDTDEWHFRLKEVFKTLEESFTRHFPFKADLVNLNASIKIFGLGFSPTSKAILGKDGMFFEGYGRERVEADIVGSFDNITDYMGLTPFSEEELEAWRVCLDERYYWLKEQGSDYVFVLAPGKALIYPENLPTRIHQVKAALNKPTRYDQLIAYLKKNSIVPVVDLRTSLLAAKQHASEDGTREIMPLYYRTDFHWTYYGAFIAYQAIVDEINTAYPKYQFHAAQLDDFDIDKKTDWVHFSFISALGLNPVQHKNETYLTFFPKPETNYATIANFFEKGISDYSLPEQTRRTYDQQTIRQLDNKRGKTPLIYVIGDSFSEKYFGYFSAHAKKTINFRAVNSFSPKSYLENTPDLVIQEVLNMYLLQRPPKNSASIKDARVRALAIHQESSSIGE